VLERRAVVRRVIQLAALAGDLPPSWPTST
jgi:hypothetical protein